AQWSLNQESPAFRHGECQESHNHPIDNDETWTDTLKPGDLVSVHPQEGGQSFIIECKLVKL
ncbi:DUF2577 family protein, partial [Mitsuokella multacida]|uniref:DUF2577 family protein n=1 Tax=Mitsuokella multacida TaxID=52226 RepID=UPI003FEF82ED